MNTSVKNLLTVVSLIAFMMIGTNVLAQSSCCAKGKDASSKACCTKASASADGKTSGCTPSNCRGAKTKFGEAKVITNLRSSLVSLKADMEKSTDPLFEERSYDIHGIVGESDDESLQIIIKEVQLIENSFVEKVEHQLAEFELPENKAQQVEYLSGRIEQLHNAL